ncbi:MAG TPA: ATP-binding cassette domain-containing protein [Polyangia bacterium]|jgi:atypical dual specificity phosphatase|nr:ATP-binding cassette domain-containing protein [Polyangia bacterium]
MGLELEGFGVAFGQRVVLADVWLRLPAPGMTVLVGPGGVGKSTLVRTLAGANDANPLLRTWGRATCDGVPLAEGERPALVGQNARLLLGTVREHLTSALHRRAQMTPLEQEEWARTLLRAAGLHEVPGALDAQVLALPLLLQRRLAVVRAVAAAPRFLCIDEPTVDLDDRQAEILLAQLRGEADRRGVLLVTHHLGHARMAGGQIALLAGGRVIEVQPADAFFATPASPEARQFVRTGCCAAPSPNAEADELEEGVAVVPLPVVAREARVTARGPSGFRWLRQGALAGMARPGLVQEIDHDLELLRLLGVTVLITLEVQPLPAEALALHGLRSLHWPIEDMAAPTPAAARAYCEEVARLLNAGDRVAIHCRAGLGRTGTLLTAQLIFEGCSALESLETVRRIEPGWVQSEAQLRFLEEFERLIRSTQSHRPVASGGSRWLRS